MDAKNIARLQQYAHRQRTQCKQGEYVEWRKVEREALKKGMKRND